MANFRTTSDLMDGTLRRCGELSSDVGTAPTSVLTSVLLYLNQIYTTLITGGNELDTEVNESWIWARAKRPIILTLNPAITSGSVTLTQGLTTGSFSVAPQLNAANISVEGWYLKADNGPETYRIVQHTSGATAFSLDGSFPQTTYSGTFHCYQLEYDLITSFVIVDTGNDTLDFIESGTTVLSATITHGSYTPAAFVTTVVAALTAAGTHGNTYSGSYDTNQRFFTFTSALNGTGSPIFTIVGNGTNFYRSGWAEAGFDYLTFSGAGSYTGTYALSATARVTQQARIYYGYQFGGGSGTSVGSGTVANVEPVRFDTDYPLINVRMGAPEVFCVTGESAKDNKLSVRFDKYPSQAMRVEFETIPYPKDLQNNAQSIPKIPRKYIRMLEFGASYYLLLDKEDGKAQTFLGVAQNMLKSMVASNRVELRKSGNNFGNVIARADLMPSKGWRRLNNYGYDSTDT